MRSHSIAWFGRRVAGIIALGVLFACAACTDLTGKNAELPAGTNDPATYNTPTGAMATYNHAVAGFQNQLQEYVYVSGMLTDEFRSRFAGSVINPTAVDQDVLVDSRNMTTATVLSLPLPASTEFMYTNLNAERAQIAQAKGALAKYAPATSPALRGRLYILEGFIEIMLADLYCGDIPLSTLDFEKDYTVSRGLTSNEVYHHASAQFDTALTLSDDSVALKNVAHIGKARALIAMDSFPEAAAAVAQIPDGFRYGFIVDWASGDQNRRFSRVTEADTEGVSGLPFISSGDPRTQPASVGTGLFPTKYTTGLDTLALGDWIEARLIQAEADLAAGGTNWLTIVNQLRNDNTFTVTGTDTTWNLGTGQVERQASGVRPLQDPGTATARADSLFADRAFWLYATGHRQGDLRRLLRAPYRRLPNQVYPFGGGQRAYPRFYHYGPDVSAPIPVAEQSNPLFNPEGCITNGS